MLVRDICIVESNNYQQNENWSYFNYLDTGNLTKNKIDSLQSINSVDDLPSRAKQKVTINDILYSSVRPNQQHYGFIDQQYDNLLVSTGFIILRPIIQKVIPKYLYYYLTQDKITNQLQVIAQNSTSSYPSITKDDLLNLEIHLPPIEEQEKIALILTKIDKQIGRNNAMVKKLQVLSQAIFNKWFVQFDYPDFDGRMQYNAILKKDIPLGWTACKLTECIKWESSSQPPKSTFSDVLKKGYIRFIQNRDYDSQNHITYIPLKSTTKICTKYDIMMDKYGDAGRIRCGLEGAYNVALAKITPTIQSSQEYIRQFLQKETNYEYLHNACMASTRASLNEQTLSGIIIPVPPQTVLSKFELMMKKIISYRFDITDSTKDLISLKEKILPLLINGQLE